MENYSTYIKTSRRTARYYDGGHDWRKNTRNTFIGYVKRDPDPGSYRERPNEWRATVKNGEEQLQINVRVENGKKKI